MENNKELKVANWVDGQMAKLNPDAGWQPNTARALARLQEERGAARAYGRNWTLLKVAGAVLACACLLAIPAARMLTHRGRNYAVTFWQSLSISGSVGASNLVPEKDRKMAADFALDDASGKRIKLSGLKGKVVLLNFWATWCHGCGIEIPWFIGFESKYKNDGFAVVGVSMDDDGWKSVQAYVEERKMNYTVVIGNQELGKSYELGSMPMTLLIDRKGKIAATHVGVVSKSDCENEIESLLKQK